MKSCRFGELHARHERFVLEAMASKRHDFIYAHVVCPHLPRLGAGGLNGEAEIFVEDYAANLMTCDADLAAMMKTLENARYQQGYVVIVSSDHWFRCLDWLDQGRALVMPKGRRSVPLMIHSSSDRNGAKRLAHPFTTVGLGGVVRRIVDERVESQAAIASLLDRLPDGETRLIYW